MSLGGEKESQKVPLNADVIMKCMCGMCSVQAKSICSQPKLKMMMDMRANMSSQMGEIKMPNPNQLPGPYCSIGKAACNDLDGNKACICNTCPVYKEHNLGAGKPLEYFCFNGKAT